MPPSRQGGSEVPEDKAATPRERVAVSWSSRLVVEVVEPDDPRDRPGARTSMSATGDPVRLSNPDGGVTCTRLSYSGDSGQVDLLGSERNPAAVRISRQGWLTAREVHSSQTAETFDIRAVGPGRLVQRLTGEGENATEEPHGEVKSSVEFEGRLDVHGLFVTHTQLELADGLGVSTGRYRALQKAVFDGRTRMRDADYGPRRRCDDADV